MLFEAWSQAPRCNSVIHHVPQRGDDSRVRASGRRGVVRRTRLKLLVNVRPKNGHRVMNQITSRGVPPRRFLRIRLCFPPQPLTRTIDRPRGGAGLSLPAYPQRQRRGDARNGTGIERGGVEGHREVMK